jgi:site-specific recombinase XerD
MPLTLKKRHTTACRKNNGVTEYGVYRRCACPIHAIGTLRLDGFIRASTGEIKWDLAELVKRQWELAGTTKVALEKLEDGPAPTTLAEAITNFNIGYVVAKRLKDGTARKYRTMLKQLTTFAEDKGYRFVKEFGLAELQQFQASWKMGARAAGKKLEHTKTFFEFCVDRGFIPANPARKMHSPIAVDVQKEPFSPEEMDRILLAARQYPSRRGATEGPKAHALVLLLRYSGLGISDALSFSPQKLDGNRAFLYRKKTGQPVHVWLPDFVVNAVKALPLVQSKYFWSTRGTDSLENVRKDWTKKLGRVFAAAGPFTSRPHAHRFRHTFAVELLLRGVAVDDVAILLGHSSPSVTLRHYSRWIEARQTRLDNVLQDAWATDRPGGTMKILPGGKKRPAQKKRA